MPQKITEVIFSFRGSIGNVLTCCHAAFACSLAKEVVLYVFAGSIFAISSKFVRSIIFLLFLIFSDLVFRQVFCNHLPSEVLSLAQAWRLPRRHSRSLLDVGAFVQHGSYSQALSASQLFPFRLCY